MPMFPTPGRVGTTRRIRRGTARPPAVGIEVTVELQRRDQREAVPVPTPSGEDVIVDPREHREDVVRRLLGLGVTARCLTALLPEWSLLIARVAAAVEAGETPAVTPRVRGREPATDQRGRASRCQAGSSGVRGAGGKAP